MTDTPFDEDAPAVDVTDGPDRDDVPGEDAVVEEAPDA